MPSLFAVQKISSPEILGQIFKDLSTDHKRIREIEVLLRLLAPPAVKDGKVAFTQPLTTRDWARFDYYACGVYTNWA
ncbi:hypothetical protein BDN71DRAFT_1587897 [Pleurotus eryngii]|uniref:Uncharacterized protein n=1 Tax=Pleurotus eryngii TaxID=5323 RepID=A0A9P6A114_PLEER|nr:hypothetical protein BDN71DRAFT_1587897 [Pleurotus eryngii]